MARGYFPIWEALPFLAQILSPLEATQVLPALISLVCAVSPCRSSSLLLPAQPHHPRVVIRLFQMGPGGHWTCLALIRSYSMQRQGPSSPGRTACDILCHGAHFLRKWVLPLACPHSAGTRTPWEWQWGGSQRAVVPSLCHSYSCHQLLQPGHTGGSF